MDRPRKGARLEVTAESSSPGGEGLVPGTRPLVVPGLWPGERAEVEVTHVGRRIRAEVVSLVEPSPGRTEPACVHHGACTGCPLMTASLPLQRTLKRQLLADHGLEVDRVVPAPASWEYRWSAKRVAFGEAGGLRLGSWRRGSHEGADMSSCRVDHPNLVACAQEVERVARELGVAPYDEAAKAGDLRAVWLRTDGERTLVTLVTARPEGSRVEELGARLERPASVAIAVQEGTGNDLRGRDGRFLRGGPLEVAIGEERVEVGPLGFLQPNPPMAAEAYATLVGGERGALALDLYAGAGVTTRMLRRRYTAVRACESFPESARALGFEPQSAEAFLEAELAAGSRPDLVVANPPRAGMGEAVCRLLGRLSPAALRIMSCHPRSLARDLAVLEETGFERMDLRAYDTLPHTTHLELVCALVSGRKRPGRSDG